MKITASKEPLRMPGLQNRNLSPLIATVLFLFLAILCHGQRYIDFTNGNDSWDGTAPTFVSGTTGPWKNVSKANPFSTQPVYFKRGEVWKGVSLTPDGSGTTANKRIFGAYGTGAKPVISAVKRVAGTDTASKWFQPASSTYPNVWGIIVTFPNIFGHLYPHRIWFNGVEQPKAKPHVQFNPFFDPTYDPSKPIYRYVTSGTTWLYDESVSTLYVYSTSNPATAISLIEYPGNNNAVKFSNSSHIIIRNLDLQGGLESTLNISGQKDFIVDSCNIGWNVGQHGLFTVNSDSVMVWDNVFDTGDRIVDTFYYQFMGTTDGITVFGSSWKVQRNKLINWGHQSISTYFTNDSTTAGSRPFGKELSFDTITDNEMMCPNIDYGRGIGWTVIHAARSVGNLMSRNYIHSTYSPVQISQRGLDFTYNRIDSVRNANHGGKAGATGFGLAIAGYSDGAVDKMNIIGNTISNCDEPAIYIYRIQYADSPTRSCVFANNILYNNGRNSYQAHYTNAQVWMDNYYSQAPNSWENNVMFYTGSTDTSRLVYYATNGDTTTADKPNIHRKTIAQFNAQNGNLGNTILSNLRVNPSFTNVASNDYSLSAGSGAIDAGIALASKYDKGLAAGSVWPSSVQTANQTGAWDVGAYVYTSAPNLPPNANAGSDITITLPVNSTTLIGSASNDPDGTISSYSWTKTAGPSTFTIVSPSSATSALNNLVQGTYTFQLTVTDNLGATSSDLVVVIVNPAPVEPPPVAEGSFIRIKGKVLVEP